MVAHDFQEYQVKPPIMVFSHPTTGEDAARATDRDRPGAVARNVTFSTQATPQESRPRRRT
jgi:hypothetical protein